MKHYCQQPQHVPVNIPNVTPPCTPDTPLALPLVYLEPDVQEPEPEPEPEPEIDSDAEISEKISDTKTVTDSDATIPYNEPDTADKNSRPKREKRIPAKLNDFDCSN